MRVSSSSSPFSSSSSLGRRTMMIRTESRKFSERVPVVTQLLGGKKSPYRVLFTTTTKRRLLTATTLVSWSPLPPFWTPPSSHSPLFALDINSCRSSSPPNPSSVSPCPVVSRSPPSHFLLLRSCTSLERKGEASESAEEEEEAS